MKNWNNRKITKGLLVLYGLCALIWWINIIMKLYLGTTGWDAGLSAFCAVFWTFVFIVWVRRYKRQQEDQQEHDSENGGTE